MEKESCLSRLRAMNDNGLKIETVRVTVWICCYNRECEIRLLNNGWSELFCKTHNIICWDVCPEKNQGYENGKR